MTVLATFPSFISALFTFKSKYSIFFHFRHNVVRDVALIYFFGECQRLALKKFSVTFFLVTVVDQLVWVSASCPVKIHFTAPLPCEIANFHS